MEESSKYHGGWLRYRCRLCGEEYQNVHVPDVTRAVSAIVYDFPNPWPLSAGLPQLIETHYHEDGSYGVSDLIGGVVDEVRK
jgi:hypothetical protein